jgi:hypothetical protein
MNARSYVASAFAFIGFLFLVACQISISSGTAPVKPVPQSKQLQSFPMNYQEESSWCGIACVDMIANYFLPGWDSTAMTYYPSLGTSYPTSANSYLWYTDIDLNASAQAFIQLETSTPTYVDGDGPGLNVTDGTAFLTNYYVGSDLISFSEWGLDMLNSLQSLFNAVQKRINNSSPMIYRINTLDLPGWPVQSVHYIVAYGYDNFTAYQDNSTDLIVYNDPYPGFGAAYPPYPETPGNTTVDPVNGAAYGGPGQQVTLGNLLNCLMFSNPGAPYGTNGPYTDSQGRTFYTSNAAGGYYVYNASVVSASASAAQIKSIANTQKTISANKASLKAKSIGSRNILKSPTHIIETDPTTGARTSPYYKK